MSARPKVPEFLTPEQQRIWLAGFLAGVEEMERIRQVVDQQLAAVQRERLELQL